MVESIVSKKQRKEEGKLKKRQRIEESGGVRPRVETSTSTSSNKDDRKNDTSSSLPSPRMKNHHRGNFNNNYQNQHQHQHQSKHRFGRVMEQVPCRNKPRYSTVSIALPGSVLSNCQTKELRTLLVGQIARAATIYHVDEIIVFDDKLANNNNNNNNYRTGSGWREFKRQKPNNNDDDQPSQEAEGTTEEKEDFRDYKRSSSQEFMARLLQYCECPQYLRRSFFPMHPDLQFVGLLAPVDAPHHVRADDRSKYREGVVLNKTGPNGMSLVNCGIRNRPVE